MADEIVLTDIDARGVATVTLNRPEVNNAYNRDMIRGLMAAFARLGADAAVRVVLIRGNGPHFQAGADLKWVMANRDLSAEENLAISQDTTDVIRGRACLVFDYEILLENSKDGVGFKTPSGAKSFMFTTVPAGEKGRVWIDRKDGRVLRIEYKATDIPKDFLVRAFQSSVDYDWVTIADEKFLLPVLSDAKFTSYEGGKLYQSRNLIRFKNYQRYGTEVKILDDDVKPEPETQKP